MTRYVLALDEGTTSTRAIVFNNHGQIVSVAQQEFPQILPAPGIVEHDPEAIWSAQIDVARDAAWALAAELAGLEPTMWGPAIAARDNVSADLAHLILHPGRLLTMGLFVIRLRESNNVVKVIDHLGTA